MKGDERIRTAVPAPGADPVYDARCPALNPRSTEADCAACDGDPEAHGLHVCGKEFGA